MRTTPRANHHLHGRRPGDSGAAVAVAGTAAADTAAVDTAAFDTAVAVVGTAAVDAAAAVVGTAAVDAAVAVVGTAAVDAAVAVVGTAAADTAGLRYLHPVCPLRVRLGLLLLHPRCLDHPSRQRKGRVPFRLSSPSPWPPPSRHMRSAQHPQEPFELTLPQQAT